MIAKKYRLTEKETKKVLHKGKPFFSYGIVLNLLKNDLPYNRFSIVIGGKSVKTSIDRNFFRRKFYDKCSGKIENSGQSYDLVFVVKKQTKLEKKEVSSIISFEKDLSFLLDKYKI
ncbi:MAG: ribonuclease P protein component [Candidatus Gracilibacteria bacterium]|nr:ribonuclease P protein component [Candidatus Gracilibacteria bacterium]